jgi:hypothetical protein
VNLLLEAGKVDGNARTTDGLGMTALMWAAACNHESITYFLVRACFADDLSFWPGVGLQW